MYLTGSAKAITIIQQHEAVLKANVLLNDIHYVSDDHSEQYMETEVFDEKLLFISSYKILL